MKLLLVAFTVGTLFLVSCGKTDGLYNYYTQAPGPGGYGAPPYGVPQINAPYQGNPNQCGPYGCFQPNAGIPQGYGQNFTPFLPIYQAMQYNQQSRLDWNYTWSYWSQNYCPQTGCNTYNLNSFLSFCNQYWSGTNYQNLLGYMDFYVYYWVTPQTQFNSYMNPQTYWAPYQQFPFYSCGSGCYY